MNANTEIDLDVLHAAIVADIKAKFPDLKTVEFYRGEGNDHDDRKTLPVPACLLNLSELEASEEDDPGTEQLAVIAHFEAELIIRFTTPNAKRSVRKLAAAFAAWLNKRRWDNPAGTTPKLPTGPVMVVGAYQDDFSSLMQGQREKPLDQYEIWKVEWRQKVHLGESVWNDEGTTPTTVYLGITPDIGLENIDKYTQIYPNE
jgi:hypothetical protein